MRSPTPIGIKFEHLLVVSDASDRGSARYVVARCDCGATKEYALLNLKSGNSRSCGTCTFRVKKHAMCGSSEYKAWQNMKERCLNADHKYFAQYGGRGITICERWLDFRNFHADLGNSAPGMSLERIDNERGYSPENCHWASRSEQNNNRRSTRKIEFNGEMKSMAEWSRKLGISQATIKGRLNRGWPPARALTEPINLSHRHHT